MNKIYSIQIKDTEQLTISLPITAQHFGKIGFVSFGTITLPCDVLYDETDITKSHIMRQRHL